MFKIGRKNPLPQQASSELHNPNRKESFKFCQRISKFFCRKTKDNAEQSNWANLPLSRNKHSFKLIEGARLDNPEIDDFERIGKPKKLDSLFSATMWEFHKDPQSSQVCRQVHRIDRAKKKVLSPSESDFRKSNGGIRPTQVLSCSSFLGSVPNLTRFLKRKSKNYHFESGAVEKIAQDISNRIGKEKFFRLVNEGKVSIERLGLRTTRKEDKYYLIIREPKRSGGFNSFQIGYSRRGTPRAIIIENICAKKDYSPEEIKQRNAVKNENFTLAERLTKENAPNVCRIMNYEDGIKVLQLGGKNLHELDLKNLTKVQRLNLYRDLFKGLFQMHSVGLCHRDLKCGNVVIHINQQGEPVPWIIDILDFLEEEGKNRLGTALIGTQRMLSPNGVAAYKKERAQRLRPVEERGLIAPANPKDDVWAAMLMICQLESKVREQDRMLSPEFIKMFGEYECTVMSTHYMEDFCANFQKYFQTYRDNLFDAKRAFVTDYPLNRLVYQMASTRSEQRPSSKEVLEYFPEHPDSFRIDVPVVKKTVMTLQELRKDFLKLSNLGDPAWKEGEQHYIQLMESCGQRFKDVFSSVHKKIVQIKAPDALQKHESQHLISSSQHSGTPEIRDDVELQVLEHLLNNLYVRFLDERTLVPASRDQVEVVSTVL